MKALKKALVVALSAAVVVVSMPGINAEAAGVLASYNFDSKDGMTDTGLGTAPSIVQDTERGNVLQFADGESCSYVTNTGSEKGEHPCKVEGGSPSSLEIPNPYAGKGLSSMTVSYWVKVTDPTATDIGAAVLGWVSDEYTSDHPDAKAGVKTQEEIGWYEKGVYIYGFTTAMSSATAITEIPMINFAGLYHNWYIYNNETFDFADSQWHHIIVTTDSSCANTKVYVDGADMGGIGMMGKRWNKGEDDASNPANTLEPTLMEVIGWAGTKLYLGHTGSSPTSSAVFLDDVVFYDSLVTDAEALSLYNQAKAAPIVGSDSTSNTAGTSNATTSTGTGSGSSSNKVSSGSTKKSTGTTTANLPQTGVMSTTALVGVGVAVIGAGAVLLKKKEK